MTPKCANEKLSMKCFKQSVLIVILGCLCYCAMLAFDAAFPKPRSDAAWVVSSTGTNKYQTLAEAISKAKSNDFIYAIGNHYLVWIKDNVVVDGNTVESSK